MYFAPHRKEGYTELTFEQFKKHVLKQNDMEKEIIGYKLKDDYKPYEKAAIELSDALVYPENGYSVLTNSCSIANFKKAGVLDLWFEPVYKEELEPKVGDWVWCTAYNWSYMGRLISVDPLSMDMWQAKGNTTFNNGGNFSKITRLATEEEVEEHLIKLAKKKGFFDGLPWNRIKSWIDSDLNYNGYSCKIECTRWRYNFSEDELCNNGATVYKKGKWATILPPQEKVVSVGGKFDVLIEGGKIWHENSDITTFVKELVNKFRFNGYVDDYMANVKEVVFSRTGCQYVETKLSDWINVLDEYNVLNQWFNSLYETL